MTLTQTELERIEHEIIRYDDETQDRYYDMVASGQNPRFALMAACQQAPGTRHTNRTFCASRDRYMRDTMKPKMRDKYLKQAKKAGISTTGKYYVGGLGRPTDPAAWVSSVDDAKSVCKKKNLTANGLVEHQGTPMPPQKTRLAPDIRDRILQEKMARDPALAAKCRSDPHAMRLAQEEVVDRHGQPCTS